jgi:Serine/Threonine/Tyrosine Kinase found in polyvalent proteins
MFPNDTRKILENIINGIILPGQEDTLTAARNYLCSGFGTSTTVEKDFERQSAIKEEQGLILEDIHDENVIVNSKMLFFIDTVFYIHLNKDI